jgi:replicative DNA helicase
MVTQLAYEEIPPAADEVPGPVAAGTLLGALRTRLELRQRAYHADGLVGLPTGLPTVDHVLQGLQPGRVYLLAAPPKLGKTTVANAIAGHVASREVPVLYLTFEMAPEDLAEAHVCRLGHVPIARTRAGMLSAEERRRWEDGAVALTQLGPLYYQQGTTRTTLDAVAAAADALQARYDARSALLVVDYLQKWALAGGGSGDQRARVQTLSAQLTELAASAKLPVLSIVSLSRTGYGDRARGSSNIAALKEAGELEYDCSAVLFLRESEQPEVPPLGGGQPVLLDVALNRFGESRAGIRLLLQRDYAEVGELENRR